MKKHKNILWWSSIIIICILGFFARLYAVNTIQYELNHDTLNYHNMANNFIEKGVLGYSTKGKAEVPNAYITPGYPLFLSAVYSVFGSTEAEDIYAVKVIQAILSSLTILLVFLIGEKIMNKLVGIIAAIFMLLYPSFLVVSALHLTETLYTFLFILYLYLQITAFIKNKKWLHLITGLSFGIAVMVRPAIFPMFIVIYLYKIIIEKDKKNTFISMLFFLAGLLTVMLPWWIRNYVLFGKIILLCTQTGNPLIAGAYPPEFAPRAYPPIEEQLSAAINAILTGFREHPKEYIKWFTIDKLNLIFKNVYLIDFLPKLKPMIILHYFCVILGGIGIFAGTLSKNARIIAAYAIMTIGVQLLFVPESRYAFPIMPMLMLLSSYLLVKTGEFTGGKIKCLKH